MAKSNVSQRTIFKIKSDRLKRDKWNIKLSIEDAVENDELISIADSQAIRFIYDITNRDKEKEEFEILSMRKELKKIKKMECNSENKKRISDIYSRIYSQTHIEEYISVEFKNAGQFDIASKKGFYVNNNKYVRMIGTTGGVKSSTIIFIDENIKTHLEDRIRNGANYNEITIVPAKLEAYRSLTFSASTTVVNTRNVVVVKDWETHFKSDITEVGQRLDGELYVEAKSNQDMSLEDSDGYGAITPNFAKKWADKLGLDYLPSGFVIRNSYCKGSLFPFDIHKFAKEIANKNMIVDVWGQEHDIDNVDIIMPVSMLKLWNAYENIDDYFDNCERNGYEFSVTKIMPKELENFRDMNYQFLQSLKLDDNQIKQLCEPTINEIKDVLGEDYRKSLVFLRGMLLNKNNVLAESEQDFIKALMIDKRMIKDPFVRRHIHRMIKKRINDAKTGVIRVKGNYTIISGDIYGFMEFVFGIENPKGLLKSGEFYSNYWNKQDVKQIVAFRAPMTCHENIKIMNLKNDEKMSEWYKYMKTCTIFNAWDCSCHTLNGADKDQFGRLL